MKNLRILLFFIFLAYVFPLKIEPNKQIPLSETSGSSSFEFLVSEQSKSQIKNFLLFDVSCLGHRFPQFIIYTVFYKKYEKDRTKKNFQ